MARKSDSNETEYAEPIANVFIDTTGDVAGDGRTSDELKANRVTSPTQPFDYPTVLPDGPDRQGNDYPPSAADLQARLARAEADVAFAREAAADAIAEAEDAADAARGAADQAKV